MTTADAARERDRAISEVLIAHEDPVDAGMKVIDRYAQSGKPFSANDIRDELRAVGVASKTTGALFLAALGRGLIIKVDYVTSSDPGTHYKPIARYVGKGISQPITAARNLGGYQDLITVPVRRDTGGRFSKNSQANTDGSDVVSLFDVGDVS